MAEVVVHALLSIDLYHLEEFNHKSESEHGEQKGAKEQAFFFPGTLLIHRVEQCEYQQVAQRFDQLGGVARNPVSGEGSCQSCLRSTLQSIGHAAVGQRDQNVPVVVRKTVQVVGVPVHQFPCFCLVYAFFEIDLHRVDRVGDRVGMEVFVLKVEPYVFHLLVPVSEDGLSRQIGVDRFDHGIGLLPVDL